MSPIACGGKPAQRVRLRFRSGLVVQLPVEVACVHRELELPRSKKDGRYNQSCYECRQRYPTPRVQATGMDSRCAQERRHKCVRCELHTGPLADTRDDRLLVS